MFLILQIRPGPVTWSHTASGEDLVPKQAYEVEEDGKKYTPSEEQSFLTEHWSSSCHRVIEIRNLKELYEGPLNYYLRFIIYFSLIFQFQIYSVKVL